MDICIEEEKSCRRHMNASAAATQVSQETHAVMDEYRTASVPGFRKGKVPLGVVQKHFHREIADTIGQRAASRLFLLAEETMDYVLSGE
jgi:FKBP-type peptidyl-prolyl cis-trans isomerase (trigger factor)